MIKKSFNNQNPNLYIISTPIGNMQDMSLRAVEILKKVTILLCEDTRIAGRLLKKIQIVKKPLLIRYDAFKENQMSKKIIKLFDNHSSIGLISDAGTPLISDPGFPLVKALKETNINVVAIPGPVAYLTALVVSGFPTSHFFYGFIPPKKSQRKKLFEKLKNIFTTLAFYVSCHKLKKVLGEISQIFPHKEIFIGKELTKLHETYYYGFPQEVTNDLPETIKGEFVLLINNNSKSKKKE